MAKKPTLIDGIYNAFYAWFDRQHPDERAVIADGFTRRDLRDAYEAGYRRARKALRSASTSVRQK